MFSKEMVRSAAVTSEVSFCIELSATEQVTATGFEPANLVRKKKFYDSPKIAKWLSVSCRTKQLWVRIPLPLLRAQIKYKSSESSQKPNSNLLPILINNTLVKNYRI